jgi:hypothetical protein
MSPRDEVEKAFFAYEQALVTNDTDALADAFWLAPEVVRFGVSDRQVGPAELRAWRAAQPPLPPGRTLLDTRIVTFGADVAVVSTRFTYPGRAVEGRQSQTWIRLPEGWRIVHAHVSEVPAPP